MLLTVKPNGGMHECRAAYQLTKSCSSACNVRPHTCFPEHPQATCTPYGMHQLDGAHAGAHGERRVHPRHTPASGSIRISQCSALKPRGLLHVAWFSKKWNMDTWGEHGTERLSIKPASTRQCTLKAAHVRPGKRPHICPCHAEVSKRLVWRWS